MYLYHGYALGVAPLARGGFYQEVSGLQAVCSPASNGGSASAQQEKSNLEGIVSFDSAHTDISWSKELREGKEIYITHASVVIERLNIADKFVADRVVTRLAAEHAPEIPDPRIVMTGSHFDNLRIAGHPVDIEYSDEPHPDESLEATMDEQIKESIYSFGSEHSAQVILHGHGYPTLKAEKKYSFFKNVQGLDESGTGAIKTRGPVVIVPQFGTIYLGENIGFPSHRIISMFRVELENPGIGAITCGTLVARPVPFVTLEEDALRDRYEQAKKKYEFLIDQKYLRGLSSAEIEELRRLESVLDEMDAPYYDQTIRRLHDLSRKEGSHP